MKANLFMPGDFYDKSRLDFLDTFANIFVIKLQFTKYLKESCWLCPDEDCPFKYLPKSGIFRMLSPKLSGCFWEPIGEPISNWSIHSWYDNFEHILSKGVTFEKNLKVDFHSQRD